MRRLITLISAGRNRIVRIRRELPRTENANWVRGPYRTKDARILLSVCPDPVTCTVPSGPSRPSLPYPRSGKRSLASPPGPVPAERREPKGSLDGWRRCDTNEDEGMAGDIMRPSVDPGIQLPFARQ